jgi:hypothetical protein
MTTSQISPWTGSVILVNYEQIAFRVDSRKRGSHAGQGTAVTLLLKKVYWVVGFEWT